MEQHLTVYHIKELFAEKCKDSFALLLRNPEDVLPFDPDKEIPFEAQLFVSKPKEESELKQPSWVAFLEPGFGELPVPATQSIGAVLFVRIPYGEKEELFAFTFGGGRHFLNPKGYDKEYGLRVALNVIYDYAGGKIEPNRLRSVASKTVAANTIRTRKQTDRQASFDIFEVDTRRDTLNAVTGTSPVKAGFWTKLLSGSESLATTPGVDLKKLGDYCKEIANTYRKKTYEDDFGWIDNRREITDPAIIGELEKTLIHTLIDTPAKITLTVPEIIDWEKVDHFSFSFDKIKFPDPSGVDLLEALRKIKGLKNKIDDLKKEENEDLRDEKLKYILDLLSEEYLIAKDIEDNEEGSWSILGCLSGEIVYKGRPYILSEGQVFEIRDNFLREINDFVGSLNLKGKGFLPDCTEDKQEGDYNEDTANEDESLLLLDKKTVRVPGRTTPIEICDLLTKGGCFVHVKKNHGSSELSHLFAQGSVSADLLSKSTLYRKVALQRIKDEEKVKTCPTKVTGSTKYEGDFSQLLADSTDPAKVKDNINPWDFEVSYAIIADWKNRSLVDALPFFSKVNLRKNVEDLERMGYKVSVACIEICPP